MIRQQILKNYRDEMIATSTVLVLSAVGIFFVVSRMEATRDKDQIEEVGETEEVAGVLGEQIQEAVDQLVAATPTPVPTRESGPTPTLTPLDTEVFYGMGGSYTFNDYELIINSPKLSFHLSRSESRTFSAEFILRNKTVEAGLLNRVAVEIVKDGNIIVPAAALSTSESRRVMPGEQLTFKGRISLIDGTDVSRISFVPTESEHLVQHNLITENP